MSLNQEMIAELNVLTQFRLSSVQEGIKVHGNAKPEMISATESLFKKGLITQKDGGYLTDLGIEAAEHAQAVFTILNSQAVES